MLKRNQGSHLKERSPMEIIMIMIMIMMIMEIIRIMRINVENEDDDNYEDNLRFVVREPHSTPISWR